VNEFGKEGGVKAAEGNAVPAWPKDAGATGLAENMPDENWAKGKTPETECVGME
jgi:hypothetical protein